MVAIFLSYIRVNHTYLLVGSKGVRAEHCSDALDSREHWKVYTERRIKYAPCHVIHTDHSHWSNRIYNVQVGKDQEKDQSEKDSHSKNRGGKNPN